jgi:hypothetical protein
MSAITGAFFVTQIQTALSPLQGRGLKSLPQPFSTPSCTSAGKGLPESGVGRTVAQVSKPASHKNHPQSPPRRVNFLSGT